MCGSRTLLEQQNILNSVDADKIIEAMRDETSSLYCLADSASALSRRSIMSEASTALFDFDAEILSSKIYGVAYRSHLRQAKTFGNGRKSPVVHAKVATKEDSDRLFSTALHPSNPSGDARKDQLQLVSREHQAEAQDQAPLTDETSNASMTATKPPEINRNSQVQAEQTFPKLSIKQGTNPGSDVNLPSSTQLDTQQAKTSSKVAAERPPVDIKMLLLGTSESGKSTILKGIKLHEEGSYTNDERLSFTRIIFANLIWGVRVVLEAMESLDISLESKTLESHVPTIFLHSDSIDSITVDVRDAIHDIIRDGGFQACLRRRTEYQLSDNMDL